MAALKIGANLIGHLGTHAVTGHNKTAGIHTGRFDVFLHAAGKRRADEETSISVQPWPQVDFSLVDTGAAEAIWQLQAQVGAAR